jgi:uncharacterized DUF497 family protein
MDDRPPVWDAANRRHVLEEHPERRLTEAEIDQVLADRRRIEVTEQRRTETYHQLLGRTRAGRWLFVVWVHHPQGRYVIHARPAGNRIKRRFSK